MAKSVYRTRKDLAEALHRDVSTLGRWIGRPDWPCGKSGPWTVADVATVKAWRERIAQALADGEDAGEALGMTDQGDSDEMRSAKLDVLRERARKLRLENERFEGKLLDAGEVEAGRIARIHAVQRAMKAAGNRLSISLAGITAPAKVAKLVEDEMRLICSAFERGQEPYAAGEVGQ